MNPFQSLGLRAELLSALAHEGYDTPTPIQTQAIPVALRGQDVLGCAQTGTGKTASFVLPILQRLEGRKGQAPRALVVTPTRELAAQVAERVSAYGWRLLVFLTALNILNFVDRMLIASLAPLLIADLGLTRAQIGLLAGFGFVFFYSFVGLFLGVAADRWRRIPLIAMGLTLWSAMTALSGWAKSFAQLALPRIFSASETMQAEIRRRSLVNLETLDAAITDSPVSRLAVEAGWSTILKLPRLGELDDEGWVLRMLERIDVWAQPGSLYDMQGCHLVLSLLTRPHDFAEGLSRLVACVEQECLC